MHTVKVFNTQGAEVFSKEVPDYRPSSNAEEAGITDPVELALLYVAPEVCPWDCDNCRS